MMALTEFKHSLDEPVTNHMRRDFAKLHPDQTVAEALESIRKQPLEARIIYFYVVDEDNQLRGVVPTRGLLLNDPEDRIEDIMVRRVIAIPKGATVLDACEFFIMHRLLAFPVVDEKRRMIGLVDIELYTTELRDLSDLEASERNEEIFQLIGVQLNEAQQRSPLLAFSRRFPWLLWNIGGGILAALLSGVFEEELDRAVALALFIPVVLALAESVAIQSVTLAIQFMHGKKPTMQLIIDKARREFFVGALLGITCGILVAGAAWLWKGDLAVVLCILGGIGGGVTCAALIGVSMPNILRLLRRDPQVAAGPIALASTDMCTLLVYFYLARMLVP